MQVGEPVTWGDIMHIFKDVDNNHDGVIDVSEFSTMMLDEVLRAEAVEEAKMTAGLQGKGGRKARKGKDKKKRDDASPRVNDMSFDA